MTRIGDLLTDGATLSFEFFPPKSEEAERQLDTTLEQLAKLNPSFVSVTYGALGTTRDRTRDIVVRFNEQHPFPTMAHLTCVGHTREDIKLLLDEYAVSEVKNILALGGDPPADGSDPGGEFAYASELLDMVRAHPAGFSVGVAAHPELHPRSEDRASDRRHLAAKLAVADFGVTQFFFTVSHYEQMMDDLAELGCDTPVIPGVMPVNTLPGLIRMAEMNATDLPAPLMERLETVGDDVDEVRKIGVDVASDLAQELLDAGAPGLHLYALNRADSITRIVENLGLGSEAT